MLQNDSWHKGGPGAGHRADGRRGDSIGLWKQSKPFRESSCFPFSFEIPLKKSPPSKGEKKKKKKNTCKELKQHGIMF